MKKSNQIKKNQIISKIKTCSYIRRGFQVLNSVTVSNMRKKILSQDVGNYLIALEKI